MINTVEPNINNFNALGTQNTTTINNAQKTENITETAETAAALFKKITPPQEFFSKEGVLTNGLSFLKNQISELNKETSLLKALIENKQFLRNRCSYNTAEDECIEKITRLALAQSVIAVHVQSQIVQTLECDESLTLKEVKQLKELNEIYKIATKYFSLMVQTNENKRSISGVPLLALGVSFAAFVCFANIRLPVFTELSVILCLSSLVWFNTYGHGIRRDYFTLENTAAELSKRLDMPVTTYNVMGIR